jgi:putative pyruvate formate lyase activating enzyme
MKTSAMFRRVELRNGRSRLAASRISTARAALAKCTLCAHHCRVNRLLNQRGQCGAGPVPRIHLAQVEMADELELIPTFGIALSGCNMRCAFCITGAQSWEPFAGELITPGDLACLAKDALANGARTVTFHGGEPTLHIPFLLETVAELPTDAKLVLKTNALCTATARKLLVGLFDVWCADYKFGNDDCAERLATVQNYTRTVRENLLWAAAHTDLIVRHLLMPGHIDCCWAPVAEWLAANLPGAKVSLRTGFWPAWQSYLHAELRGTINQNELEKAVEIARKFKLNLIE